MKRKIPRSSSFLGVRLSPAPMVSGVLRSPMHLHHFGDLLARILGTELRLFERRRNSNKGPRPGSLRHWTQAPSLAPA